MVTRSSEGMVLVDAQRPELPVVYANPAYEALSGYAGADLAGSAWPLLDGEADAERERLKAALGRAETCEAELTDTRKDGTAWGCHVSVEPLYDAQGKLKYFLCLQRPTGATEPAAPRAVTALRAFGPAASRNAPARGFAASRNAPARGPAASRNAPPRGPAANGLRGGESDVPAEETGRNRKVALLDRLDSATGLLRLSYFEEMLDRDLAMARRDGRPMALLVFEIIDFDVYQRTFGAKAADSCHRMIGAQITRALRRAGDLCTRFDETTLVASTVGQPAEDLKPVALRIVEHVRLLGLHNPRGRGRYVAVRAAIVDCPPGTAADAAAIVARGRAALPDAAGALGITRMTPDPA